MNSSYYGNRYFKVVDSVAGMNLFTRVCIWQKSPNQVAQVQISIDGLVLKDLEQEVTNSIIIR